MLRFTVLLWILSKLIARTIHKNPTGVRHAEGKDVSFQIRTRAGNGRYFRISDGHLTSRAGLVADPDFTFTFEDAATGFRILSAKEDKAAFLQGVHDGALQIEGDFVKVMWFQRLSELLKPATK
jgi:hypothetical protein